MRGIVTLAAAFALPETLPGGQAFPFRDLVVLCAFAVVLGTLVIQGLTLRPLIRWLCVGEQDPVAHEVRQGRVHIYRALLEAVADDDSPAAARLRDHYRHAIAANLDTASGAPAASGLPREWPSGVPAYPDARLIAATITPDGAVLNATFGADAAMDQAFATMDTALHSAGYRTRLEDGGEDMLVRTDDQISQDYVGPGFDVNVVVAPGAGQTLVMLNASATVE